MVLRKERDMIAQAVSEKGIKYKKSNQGECKWHMMMSLEYDVNRGAVKKWSNYELFPVKANRTCWHLDLDCKGKRRIKNNS